MWTILKIVGEIVVFFGFLYGLCASGILGLENVITIGMIGVIFILCYQEQKISIQKSIEPIKNALAEIQKWLADNFNFVPLHEIKPTGYIQQLSPINLTELGQNLLGDSGAKGIIDNDYNEFERLINEQNCKTAYDVQMATSKIIARKENEVIMNPLKDFAYRNPRFKENILTFTDIQRVMIIYLRNVYLKNHPEIK